MDPLNLVPLARTLIDIDSTTGREADATRWLAAYMRERGFTVTLQPVAGERANLLATLDAPAVVFSTHIDCVPPFFASREEDDLLFGRGSCDAKGILAAQITALERLREAGERRVGLLVVVGEERGSDGAMAADALAAGSRFLINGEPTDNRLGLATRGNLRLRFKATGRAAHSSHPELGDSAIDKLIDALVRLRDIELPEHPVMGRTFYTVGLMSGGLAPNVIPPNAEAEAMFRTVGDANEIRARLGPLDGLVTIEDILEVPPVTLTTVPDFQTEVFPYTTDIPFLSGWGRPLLFGPGSVLVAHTADEHVRKSELAQAVDDYARLATVLIHNAS